MDENNFRTPRKKDLTGQKFGKLTVVRETDERKNSYIVWECRCDCGNTHYVRSNSLLDGSTTSCGCEGRGKGRARDLTGQKFGLLTAIEPTEQRKNRSIVWKCECECGNIILLSAKDLKQGGKKSCGCLDTSGIKDLTGQKFGMLTVLEKTEERDHNTVVWKCECECGNTVLVSGRDLIHNRKDSCGCASMNKPKDLIGQRFGKLEVVEMAEERKNGRVQWLCKCDCGNTTVVDAYSLTSGSTRSCGCLQSRRHDLTGQRFGMLEAVRPTDRRQWSSIIWECKCDCGNTAFVSARQLMGGQKSCGCRLNMKKKYDKKTPDQN